ncbi:Hypothetical predicted protein [Olea europaea subsp. europaea]|uniref:Uncharacterized protein n=1 Tax=Olea europaea subsp. europaea TaxID=158383 RepID=A0A8S0QDM4_OLEEU|nr:Hypothetical predicted protein [Olea europaea subsp. europaea]
MPITSTPAEVAPSSDGKLAHAGPQGSEVCRDVAYGSLHVLLVPFDVTGTEESHVRDANTFGGISGDTVRRPLLRMRANFQAFLGTRRQHGVQAMSGMQTHSQAFLGYFWDMVFRPCPGDILAAEEKHPDFQEFLGHVFGTRCASHVKDALGKQPDFQAFLGSFWDMMCRPCPVHVQAMAGMWPDFSGIFGQFQGTVCRPFSGRFLAIVGTLPMFQAFLSSFWDMAMSGTRLSHDGTQADFQAHEGNTVCRPSQGRRLVCRHSRKFLRYGVHAKSRTR